MRPKELFEDILTSMGVSFTGTISRVIQKLTNELNTQDAPLIIIDEAGKLNQVVLMYLHDLWDGIETSSGVVLAGVGYFKTNLLKAVRKEKEGMPEFNSRIGYWQELANPTKAEIKAICKHNGVTDEEEIKQVLNAKDFRYLNQIIKNKLR